MEEGLGSVGRGEQLPGRGGEREWRRAGNAGACVEVMEDDLGRGAEGRSRSREAGGRGWGGR